MSKFQLEEKLGGRYGYSIQTAQWVTLSELWGSGNQLCGHAKFENTYFSEAFFPVAVTDKMHKIHTQKVSANFLFVPNSCVLRWKKIMDLQNILGAKARVPS